MTEKTQSLSYKDAGVDIDAGNALIEKIKGAAKRTRRPEVMAGLGGFGALFELPTASAINSSPGSARKSFSWRRPELWYNQAPRTSALEVV